MNNIHKTRKIHMAKIHMLLQQSLFTDVQFDRISMINPCSSFLPCLGSNRATHLAVLSLVRHQLFGHRSDSLGCEHLLIMALHLWFTTQVPSRKEYVKYAYAHGHERPIEDGEVDFMSNQVPFPTL